MRPLTAVDAKAMAVIHAKSFERGWPELDMAVHINRDLCFGLGDPLISFVILSVVDDQAEILTIATHPDHRGTGQGTTLLRGAMSRLASRGVQTLFLEVAEDNVAAQSLYRRAGFDAIGRRPGYYRREKGRVAALTFSKRLDAAK